MNQDKKPPSDIKTSWVTQALLIIIVLLTSFFIPFIPGLLSSDEGYGLPAHRAAPEFTLQDAQGAPVSLSDFRGKYVFLMFGYIHCRDICHSQALIFQEIQQRADMNDGIKFLYITMDPERDTAERLATYFDKRGENFTSLRSDDIQVLQALAGEYRAFFAREGNIETADYEVQHPGLYFLIGPEGNVRYTYTANQKRSDLIVSDLTRIRKEYEQI